MYKSCLKTEFYFSPLKISFAPALKGADFQLLYPAIAGQGAKSS